MSEDTLREELRRAYAAHALCDKERQEAYDKIRELQEQVPAQDEDYRYRVEQIAARIMSGWYEPHESFEDAHIDTVVRMARKLVCAVEAMDRG